MTGLNAAIDSDHAASPAILERWPWCTCPPDPTQLALFDARKLAISLEWEWPLLETSWCGRFGFWRRRTPELFGDRRGVGPLVISPDTNILISLYENLGAAEEAIGLGAGPLAASEWPTTVDALRDLVGLWWWRDVRFWVDRERLLGDARTGIRADRLRAREIAIEQLSQDFFERGGLECHLSDDVRAEDPVCPVHPDASVRPWPVRTPAPRWPSRRLDRALLRAALQAGCHVFMTEDRGILRSHLTLRAYGIAVLRPSEVLESLDATRELEPVSSAYGPVPDISALARFYSLRAPEDT